LSNNATTKEIRSLLKVDNISAVTDEEVKNMIFEKSVYFWVTL
jgi:hypothetical protein